MNLEGEWTKFMKSRAKKMIKYVGDQAKLDEDMKRKAEEPANDGNTKLPKVGNNGPTATKPVSK